MQTWTSVLMGQITVIHMPIVLIRLDRLSVNVRKDTREMELSVQVITIYLVYTSNVNWLNMQCLSPYLLKCFTGTKYCK